jgi:hypothetical protein
MPRMYLEAFSDNPFGTNCWLLSAEGSDDAVVIDPGFEPGRIRGLLESAGKRPVAFYGDPRGSDAIGDAYLDGRRVDGDMHLVFLRSEPRSALSLVPEMIERAALFKPGGAGLLGALLGLVAVGVPLLLAAALRGALREGGPGPDRT